MWFNASDTEWRCRVNKIVPKFNFLTCYFSREYLKVHLLMIRHSYLPSNVAIYWLVNNLDMEHL